MYAIYRISVVNNEELRMNNTKMLRIFEGGKALWILKI